MSPIRLEPSIRATFIHRLFPESEGTVTRRFSTRPLADAGAFSQGRVYSFSPITRRMTRPDGSYDAATARIELSDEDGYFRGLMAGATTRYLTGSELTIEILSETGRAAGGDWRPLIRGRVTDVQCPPNRRAVLEVTDMLAAGFTGYDLDKLMGVPMTRDIFPQLPAASIGRIFPIVVGEHSTIGWVDANGNSAAKGKLPAIHVGAALIGDDGSINPDDGTFGHLAPPEEFSVEVTGTAGNDTQIYGVTAFSENGETTLGPVLNLAIPDDLGVTEGVQAAFSWTPVDGAVAYGIYAGGKRREVLDGGYTTWIDTTGRNGSGPEPPRTNTALVSVELNGVVYTPWQRFVLKIGAASEIFAIYASDLAAGETPKRAPVPMSAYGTEVLAYGFPGYPRTEPYVDENGVRFADIFVRGPRAQHAIDNTVTIAWDGCGDEEVGDGSGATITEAFWAWQHILNEYALKNRGIGYRTGTFGPIETFDDGTPILRTTAVHDRQDDTVGYIGGRGYQANIAITTPITAREFDTRFRTTFRSETASNHWGQLYPCLISTEADPDEGRLYHDRINIARMESQEFGHERVVTRQLFHYDRDEDAQTFRQNDLVIEDTLATDSYGGVAREGQPASCYYSADAATVYDAQARHVTRYKVAPREIGISTDLGGLEDENGEQVRVTLADGAGGVNGDVLSPFTVIEHETDPSKPGAERVVLTLLDLTRTAEFAFPLIEDETAMDPNIGDETSLEPPTVGAYECR